MDICGESGDQGIFAKLLLKMDTFKYHCSVKSPFTHTTGLHIIMRTHTQKQAN